MKAYDLWTLVMFVAGLTLLATGFMMVANAFGPIVALLAFIICLFVVVIRYR